MQAKTVAAIIDFLQPPRLLSKNGILLSLNEQTTPSLMGTATVKFHLHKKEPRPHTEEEDGGDKTKKGKK